MTITKTTIDDNGSDGTVHWFDIDGETYGYVVSGTGRRWVDCDGSPLDVPSQHIAPADIRTAESMTA